MAITYNPQVEGFTFTPQSEKGDKAPFKVKLKTIDSSDIVRLQDGFLLRGSDNNISLKTGSYNVQVCLLGIVGWENVKDVKGKDIEITLTPAGTISDESLNRVPPQFFEEFATAIVAVSSDPSKLQFYADE